MKNYTHVFWRTNKLFSKVEGRPSTEIPPNVITQLQICLVFDPFWKGFGGKNQVKWGKVEYRLVNLEKSPFLGDLVRLKTAFSPSKKSVYNFSSCEINYILIMIELIKKCYAIRPLSWCLWENWPLKMYPRLRSNFIWLYFPKYSANMAQISLGTRLFATLPLRYAVWFSKTSETRVNCKFH